MSPENNEEKKISEWMVARDREAYRQEAEKTRLAEFAMLDQHEKELCGKIEQQEKLFTCAESEAALAREQFESAARRGSINRLVMPNCCDLSYPTCAHSSFKLGSGASA